jgi:hypothetical protein
LAFAADDGARLVPRLGTRQHAVPQRNNVGLVPWLKQANGEFARHQGLLRRGAFFRRFRNEVKLVAIAQQGSGDVHDFLRVAAEVGDPRMVTAAATAATIA